MKRQWDLIDYSSGCGQFDHCYVTGETLEMVETSMSEPDSTVVKLYEHEAKVEAVEPVSALSVSPKLA